jgi:(1->4)-alpha-D-glucan 1-alpha-D-glucosylmutase
MTATATHDTKLGEDTRARVAAISERPDEWQRAVLRWSRLARQARGKAYGEPAPDRNDEYRFYQVLAGIWPPAADDAPIETAAPADFVERLQQYMDKASREAKLHTSWINPNQAYDTAMRDFVQDVLAGRTARRFLPEFVPFARSLARAGAANSLSQLLIKIAAPGVPDFYQGTELWDLTLVDPDNRRPVDFDLRCRLARELEPLVRAARSGDERAATRVAALLDQWPDGRIKLFTTLAGQSVRRDCCDLFVYGRYVPLLTHLPPHTEVLAFARVDDGGGAVAIAPTLTRALGAPGFAVGEVWKDARLEVPAALHESELLNVLTGERVAKVREGDNQYLELRDVLRTLPIALLLSSR